MELVRDKRVKDAYMVETLQSMFDRGDLRKDHPFQRKPVSWSNDYRDGFAATIIKQEDVDSIKVCEQLTEDGVILWVIDGGHRLTTLKDFKKNAFKIGSKIDMPIIKYQTAEKDSKGKTIYKTVKYDLRGKRYSDLPDELKEKFDNCKIDMVKHLDCSDEEIAYHIRRYNKQKAMNVSQMAVTYMEKTAQYLKSISTNNRFFKDCGAYGKKDRANGAGEADRIIMESVMCMFHLDNWKKGGRAIAEYIDEFATKEEFDILNSNLTELSGVVTDEIDCLFNNRDSFVWFTLFNKCLKYGKSKESFVEFLMWFNKDAEANEKFSGINDGGTKDKKVITEKLLLLETLMLEYLHINIEETKSEDIDILDFVREYVGQDIEREDIDFYEEMLNDLTLEVDNDTKLLEEKNKPSLLAIAAYGCQKDIDLDNWFINFFGRTGKYIHNQKENYIKMRDDLEKYILRKERVLV